MPEHPFADLSGTPAEHFKLCFYATVLRVLEHAADALGGFEELFEHFPFLVGYNNQLAEHGLDGLSSEQASQWWAESLEAWEKAAEGHLPLRALREAAGLDHWTMTMWLSIGLIEEDIRFGLMFEKLQGTPGQRRPTAALLAAWWSDVADQNLLRGRISRLRELGLIQALNPDAPRNEWVLQIPVLLWDSLRGAAESTLPSWLRYRKPEELTPIDRLILPDGMKERLAQASALLASGELQALIVRGPQHNGRRTVAGAVARALGRGLLEVTGAGKADEENWRTAGALATLFHAMPAIVVAPSTGETVEIDDLRACDGPIGVVLGQQGGIAGAAVERSINVTLEIPDAGARRLHWREAAGDRSLDDLEAISERYRMTSGNIRRAAKLAVCAAAMEDREAITLADVQEASRTLNRQALDTLAARVPVSGEWNQLAAAAQTLAEIRNLERRCRHRERLRNTLTPALSGQMNAGIRALFTGPSGTGKTHAARLLASALQLDLYRVDLSSVVNKYIGETEKNLGRIFASAEELNVILLLDEGDSLLTQRTNVQTSNDRYANLETNYLLQRLETFEGILIITSNAGDRIDSAFQRRMDVVVDFRAPEAVERWAIWQMHLPAGHRVDPDRLNEIAGRCVLTGGQIRNAVLHASLLALDNGGALKSEHLEAAVLREYRKIGAVYPLRVSSAASALN